MVFSTGKSKIIMCWSYSFKLKTSAPKPSLIRFVPRPQHMLGQDLEDLPWCSTKQFMENGMAWTQMKILTLEITAGFWSKIPRQSNTSVWDLLVRDDRLCSSVQKFGVVHGRVSLCNWRGSKPACLGTLCGRRKPPGISRRRPFLSELGYYQGSGKLCCGLYSVLVALPLVEGYPLRSDQLGDQRHEALRVVGRYVVDQGVRLLRHTIAESNDLLDLQRSDFLLLGSAVCVRLHFLTFSLVWTYCNTKREKNTESIGEHLPVLNVQL